jgi:two-component sensor histidine kinase
MPWLQNKTALVAGLKGDAGRVLAKLLTRECQHRTKNLFAVMLAVVSRNFVGKHTVKDAEAAVIDRLQSLGKTHLMLFHHEWA